MYWNIGEILPYQRHFNFINGPREIGKTYTTLKWLIKQAITKDRYFVYICRTQDEKKNGILKFALDKVMNEQYPELEPKYSSFTCIVNDVIIAKCVALSEYMKIKKYSFPGTCYFIFDEYMLESNNSGSYVQGWNEPDLLLNIYQTIDRGNDNLIGFLLGNNTNFYNPYHLHPAFNIPFVNPGKIWTSHNVLFQRAMPSKSLSERLEANAITKQIKDTSYGKYAVSGDYMNHNDAFLGKLDGSCIYQFTMRYNDRAFGVYTSPKQGVCIVSDKIEPNCKFDYAFTMNDHIESTTLIAKDNVHLKWLGNLYKHALVKFTSHKVREQCKDIIRMVVK